MYLKDKIFTNDAIESVKFAKDKGALIGIDCWRGEAECQELINHGFRIFHTRRPEAFAKFLNNK